MSHPSAISKYPAVAYPIAHLPRKPPAPIRAARRCACTEAICHQLKADVVALLPRPRDSGEHSRELLGRVSPAWLCNGLDADGAYYHRSQLRPGPMTQCSTRRTGPVCADSETSSCLLQVRLIVLCPAIIATTQRRICNRNSGRLCAVSARRKAPHTSKRNASERSSRSLKKPSIQVGMSLASMLGGIASTCTAIALKSFCASSSSASVASWKRRLARPWITCCWTRGPPRACACLRDAAASTVRP